jgi:diadenosine tetraphosphatase ApaH/serine/threonine PP2A family protein phosphatase
MGAFVIALFADVHSNLEALQACLKHARASGARRFAFLGDLVGYGAEPQGVIAIVQELVSQGAIAVKGNHDEAVEYGPRNMNATASAAIVWTQQVLREHEKNFLSALPLCVHEEGLCFVHASAEHPERWSYVDSPAAAQLSSQAAQSAYVFSGHVHHQALFFENGAGRMSTFRPVPGKAVPAGAHRRWLALVGSVGQPRDGDPAAAYALFDSVQQQIMFRRVPYDNYAAAEKIRKAGLPAQLAYRVERGI